MSAVRGVVVVMVAAACGCGSVPEVDRFFVAAHVHRDGTSGPGAIVVREGRIVAVGEEGALHHFRRVAREVVELGDAHVFPGLTESHGHLLGFGAALEQVDLVGARSFQEVIARVREAARALPPGEWVVGRGWDQNDWPDKNFPHHAALSAALPDHPALLRRIDGHAVLTNAAGLAAAGITGHTPDPPGGRILRDQHGEPSGVLVDAACELLERAAPAPSPEAVERQVLLAGQRLASLGFTEIHDAGTTRQGLEVLQRLAAEGRLPIRVYAMVEGSDEAAVREAYARGAWLSTDGMLAVRAVKYYADGALGSRGALLGEPYTDEPGTRGLEVTPLERLGEFIRRAGEAGFQPCVHAIGDAAVRRVLDLYERELGGAARTLRARIEHAQIVREEDVPRFAALGVIASVQPTHCTSDMPWAPQRLGPERIAWAYRWRSLLAAGARLCLGSDVPVENPDPRRGVWAAVTRRPFEGTGGEGWNLPEALTAAEAVAGFTSWAAYAAFEEEWRGAIRAGFAADFTVVDRDLSAGEVTVVREARILRTVVAGRDVFVARGVQ
ncbi:MAG: amidohydrolase [Thermoanaerobaculaceae bacterium]|nr:amidohydrolase [Thermoanaerobaculaceae bacterium]